MTTADDLNTSISEMTTEELLQRITELRKARRIRPENSPRKAKKPSAVASKNSLAALLKQFSPEELEQLIKGELNG